MNLGNVEYNFRVVSIVYYVSEQNNPLSGHYYCYRKNDSQWLYCDDTTCIVNENIYEHHLNAYYMLLEKI